jgi:hypothetical protein
MVVQYRMENIFASWSTRIVGSNPTRCIGVCVRLICVCVVLCRYRIWSPLRMDLRHPQYMFFLQGNKRIKLSNSSAVTLKTLI